MLLHLTYSHSSLPPKALPADPSRSHPSSFFSSSPLPRTLHSQNPKPYKSPLIRCSATGSETLPKSAIQRIAEKLRSLGFAEETQTPIPDAAKPEDRRSSPGEIFVPLPTKLPKHRVGYTLDTSWSTPENPVPEPGSGNVISRFNELRDEMKEQKQLQKGLVRQKAEKVPTLAELTLPPEELRRLRGIGIALKKKLNIGKAGVTEGIVNGIHERWLRSEVVKIECKDFVKMNMKRTHDLLERKTGGLVIWRSGSKILLYRGTNYKYPYFLSDEVSKNGSLYNIMSGSDMDYGAHNGTGNCSPGMGGVEPAGPSPTNKMAQPKLVQGVGLQNRVRFELPGERQLIEEADRLLDGLGPRYNDWWGYDPLPVDGDLLPATIRGYRKPFRLLPYGVKPKLTNDEMTILRRLGRPLPCHFVLGRNRKLQGLAASILKLWERCEIAKIAVKRGVQNTNSEMMAEELLWLTGGTLLSRDKDFIVLYRGKDFLPLAVSSAIQERRRSVVHEEKQTTKYSTPLATAQEDKLGSVGCSSEDKIDKGNDQKRILFSKERKKKASESAIKRTSIKLSMALEQKAKAEKLLEELEKAVIPQQTEVDKEGITEEERYMLRKVGLRMKPFLLLGRRGVFDGTIENMHLHWKYRELVKILANEKSIGAVHQVAQTLEAESGGVLVAVERVSKGYAIIVYRGKNYERPASLRPQTLLNKREALKRTLEAQRCKSLKLHVLKLTKNIDHLKLKLVKDEEASSMPSADESRFQLVKEEISASQSANFASSDTDLKSGGGSQPLILASHEENAEVGEKYEADLSSTNVNYGMDALANSLQTSEQDKLFEYSSQDDGNEAGEMELESSSESAIYENHANEFTNINGKSEDAASCPDNQTLEGMSYSVDAEHCVSNDEAIQSSVESVQNNLGASMKIVAENKANKVPSRTKHLSNRDRLLLRKQALKMKKRPLLAVGRSNVVTGVAKAIKEHFERHPLAIVNVKGRAEGTSVQEVVFKLEQATGAVLVSQEPSKVILYRGWGAEDEPQHFNKKNARGVGKTSSVNNKRNARGVRKTSSGVSEEGEARPAVSPELMAAIKFECGLL